MRVYNRALSAAEIQSDINTPIQPAAPDTTPPTAPTGSVGDGREHCPDQSELDRGHRQRRSDRVSGGALSGRGVQQLRAGGHDLGNESQRWGIGRGNDLQLQGVGGRRRRQSGRLFQRCRRHHLVARYDTSDGADWSVGDGREQRTDQSELDRSDGQHRRHGVSRRELPRCRMLELRRDRDANRNDLQQRGWTPARATATGCRAMDAAGQFGRLLERGVCDDARTAGHTAPTAPATLTATAAVSGTASGCRAGRRRATTSAVTQYRIERCQGAGCTTFAPDGDDGGHDVQRHRADAGDELQLPRSRHGRRRKSQRLLDHGDGHDAPDTMAPTTPGGAAATAVSDTRVDVTWTASTDNVAVTGTGSSGARARAARRSRRWRTADGLSVRQHRADGVDGLSVSGAGDGRGGKSERVLDDRDGDDTGDAGHDGAERRRRR